MKFKPILFSTAMVQAILAGRKSITRRVIKPQPICSGPNITFKAHDKDVFLSAEKHWLRCRECGNDPQYSREGAETAHHYEPNYKPGDILWVRETFRPAIVKCNGGANYFYYADGFSDASSRPDTGRCKWKPSIHMPREAARIFLRVTDVRVERVLDITLDDIEREGLYCDPPYTRNHFAYGPGMSIHWIKLWDSLNNKRGYGWDTNPWVWAISFECCERPEAL